MLSVLLVFGHKQKFSTHLHFDLLFMIERKSLGIAKDIKIYDDIRYKII